MEEENLDLSLRPHSLESFVGQKSVLDQVQVLIQASQMRGEAVEHVLFSGPPGLGKTTLSQIIAKELKSNLKTTTGPLLEKPSDLIGILTSLKDKDILFIDEIHRVNRTVEEYLYSAMEDYVIDIILDKGVNAQSVSLALPPFTLVGATTRSGLLSSPLRSRFGLIAHLDYYSIEELVRIILRSARILGIEIDFKSATMIAERSRGVARHANRLLKRVRDVAQVYSEDKKVTVDMTHKALDLMQIDVSGLEKIDMTILDTIENKFSGGPVGLKTLSIAVGEEADTLSEVHEPYLIYKGFLKRTARGRCITLKGQECLENKTIQL